MIIDHSLQAETKGLGGILERLLRPAIGFNRPSDVLKDDDLSNDEKRAILSSWASDSCAVEGKPYLRWMVGSDDPVPLDEVLEALARIDGNRHRLAGHWPRQAFRQLSHRGRLERPA